MHRGGIFRQCFANIYLHYALDLWFTRLFVKSCEGRARLIRYCDDFVVCFQRKSDAKRFRAELDGRLGKFGLEVAAEKTKILEFGPLAELKAKARGEKPQTFDFSGADALLQPDAERQAFPNEAHNLAEEVQGQAACIQGMAEEEPHTAYPGIDENGCREVAGAFCLLRGDGQLAGNRSIRPRGQEAALQMAEPPREKGMHVLGEVREAPGEISPAEADELW